MFNGSFNIWDLISVAAVKRATFSVAFQWKTMTCQKKNENSSICNFAYMLTHNCTDDTLCLSLGGLIHLRQAILFSELFVHIKGFSSAQPHGDSS